MFISTKLLPVLALAVNLAPLAAQARNGDPRLIYQANASQMTPACWTTNFRFQPASCKHAACTDVQKGFWPRPSVCAR
jgi:hypothetical protein